MAKSYLATIMAKTQSQSIISISDPLIKRGRSHQIICPSPALVFTQIVPTISHLTLCDSNEQLVLRLFAVLGFGEYQQ